MNKIAALLALLAVTFITMAPAAQEPQPGPSAEKCEGPPDLCSKIAALQVKVSDQKKAAEAAAGEKTEEQKNQDKKHQDRVVKLIAAAGTISAVLKVLLSALSGWKDYFTTDVGKAWLRAITLVVGFVAFIMTNIGFGIPWWQALIVAGGGPGAILVHEMMKLIPAIRGKGPLPPEAAPPATPGV